MAPPDPRLATVIQAREARYPDGAPFHPSERYPEAPFTGIAADPNPVYEGVRRAMAVSGWDGARLGSTSWNPLGAWIRPGDTVLLKPNLVKEAHPRDPDGWRYVMTHGSFIRAVADYVTIALAGKGAIWLADAPQTDSSWEAIVRVLELEQLAAFYRAAGVGFELIDLRKQEWRHRDGVPFERRDLAGDPRGYVAFDLGGDSEFVGHLGEGNYYGADYATGEVNGHHVRGRHEYLMSGSAIAADVFINLPKLKTHKKVGITVNLKNLVGINGDKNWLPHHTEGDPRRGGDEVPEMTAMHRVERAGVRALRHVAWNVPVLGPRAMAIAKRLGAVAFGDTETVVRSGNWYGNDTTWRMCLDLNKLLLYGNRDGSLRAPDLASRKRYLSFVDGIVAGQGRGPMNPDPVAAGVVLAGSDPAVVDLVCAVLMGFDADKMPIVRHAFESRGWPVASVARSEVELVSDRAVWCGAPERLDPESLFAFEPHFGWKGRIEAGWRR